jgi:hypothetical protein
LKILDHHEKYIDAVCFLGGTEEDVLEKARLSEVPCSYYTGAKRIMNTELMGVLTWIKVGDWQGIPLFEEGTNQVMIEKDGEIWKIL